MANDYFDKLLKGKEEKMRHLGADNFAAPVQLNEQKPVPVIAPEPEVKSSVKAEEKATVPESFPVATAAEKKNILEVNNLSVSFGGEIVIGNLSFNLKEGENLAVVGPNGAGKSVLLKALLGVLPYSDGSGKVAGQIKWEPGLKISYVPQKILPEKGLPLSVEEFFKIKGAKKDQAAALLQSVGLVDKNFLKKRISDISSGQLQRTLVAWGLIGEPQVLLFDEPTSGIDIGGEETVYNLLWQMEKERNLSIILVTHDLNVVYKFANKVLCLNKEMVCFGEPKQALEPSSLNKLYGGEVNFYTHEH